MMLLGTDTPFPDTVIGLNLFSGSGSVLSLNNGDSDANKLGDVNMWTNEEWKLFTVTFDGSVAVLYVNAVRVGQAPTYRSFHYAGSDRFVLNNTFHTDGSPYRWGRSSGRFTNFAVWNERVLSEHEIKTLYHGGNPTNTL